MTNQKIMQGIGRVFDYAICAAISTVGATMANQFIVPKILEMREENIKARKNPIGFRAD